MADGYASVAIDAIPTLAFGTSAEPDWKPLRHHLGVRAFGLNVWVAARAGDPAIETHDELSNGADRDAPAGHEEVYVVLRGAARFTVGGDEIEAPAGTAVFVSDPSLTRGAIATADDTQVLVVGAQRGVAFEPSAWEHRWLQRLGALGDD